MDSEITELPPALGTSRIFTASFERFIRVKWRLGSKSQNTIPPLLLSCNNDKNLNHWLRRTVKFSPKYILHGWNCCACVWERTPAPAADNIGVPGVPPWQYEFPFLFLRLAGGDPMHLRPLKNPTLHQVMSVTPVMVMTMSLLLIHCWRSSAVFPVWRLSCHQLNFAYKIIS